MSELTLEITLLKVLTATAMERELLEAHSSLAVTLEALSSENIPTSIKPTNMPPKFVIYNKKVY